MSLRKFENRYEGERAFLLGNGPSLAETPLERLDDEYTFAMNKINLLYDDTEWRPSFFIMAKKNSINNEQLSHYMETISLGVPSFVTQTNYPEFPERDDIHPYDRIRLTLEGGKSEADMAEYIDPQYAAEQYQEIWSDDVTDTVVAYASSMYDTVQIASYMGFTDLYLLGCDLGYEENVPYVVFEDALNPKSLDKPIRSVKNSDAKAKSMGNLVAYKLLKTKVARPLYPYLAKHTNLFADPNHFDDSYQPHQRYRNDINTQLERSHEILKNVGDQIGVSIYNATLGGNLEAYPRVDLDEILSNSSDDTSHNLSSI